jgi:heavy metal sensor kinase
VKRIGIRARLSLIYTALFAAELVILGLVFYHARMQQVNGAVNAELDDVAAGLRGYLQFPNGTPVLSYDRNDPGESGFVSSATRFFRIYDADSGRLIFQSPEMSLMSVELSPAQIQRLAAKPRLQDGATARFHIRIHNSVVRGNDNRRFLMQVGTSLATVDAARREFVDLSLALVPLAILLAGTGGYWITILALRPVESLRSAAHDINIRQMDRQLPLRGAGDELDRLASTFNETFARINRAFDQMREFSSAIAHELRTPLTAMRGQAEVALLRARSPEEYRAVLVSQVEELDKLSAMAEDALILARAEVGEMPMRLEVVDVGEIAQRVCEHLSVLAESRSLKLQAAAGKAIYIRADRHWLERIVFNLVDNALKFTPDGGSIELSVLPTQESAVLEVSDTGVGISPDSLPHIFEQFYRADQARSRDVNGVGLGLALVQTLVKAHGGTIQVESEAGRGSVFRVFFPMVPAATAIHA